MTGPEHFRRAETLLRAAMTASQSIDALPSQVDKAGAALTSAPVMANLLSQAQVHATLALTAATILPVVATEIPKSTTAAKDWRAVIVPAEEES